jgi:hypothetical protein
MPHAGIVYTTVPTMDENDMPAPIGPDLPAPTHRHSYRSADARADMHRDLMAYKRYRHVAMKTVMAAFSCWGFQTLMTMFELTQYYMPFAWIMVFVGCIWLDLNTKCLTIRNELNTLHAAIEWRDLEQGAAAP